MTSVDAQAGSQAGTQAEPAAPSVSYAGRTPYVEYGDIDVLASLIHPKTDEPLEVTFIVATQIMELHFNLLLHEWGLAIDKLDHDDLPEASAALRRSVNIQESLNRSWDLLSVMSPVQYNRFRGSLGKASGFQSFAYRQMEFVLGAKNERMLNPHTGMPGIHAHLQASYDNPSLYDTALAFLARRGLAIPAAVLKRDVRTPWTEADAAVIEAWRQVYAREDELTDFADLLTAIAERHSTWRFVHYTAVKRILGAKPGTGGSAGMSWLKRTVDTPVFVDLWEVRSVL
ncbi:MAG TPA: tryptophan 2,3-dioxygenase family protein [Jatrophihabitans sp.]|jgi:tryptophan 2,3-dioxygenase